MLGLTVAFMALPACDSLDSAKASAYLTARENQVAHERGAAELLCRRGSLSASESAEALQSQAADGRALRTTATNAERALLESNPPERIRTAVAELSRAAANVQANSASVVRTCPTGSTTDGTGAARRQLQQSLDVYRDHAAVFRTQI